MNPNLKVAIIEFIANEFHLAPEAITPDLNFTTDLGLSQDQISDLLQRIQDALNFILPDEKSTDLDSVGDLLNALEEDHDQPS